ncbi:MAG: phenolic acid decarboxylase [Acidobacteriaceae bacterium]|nr:phenolic acid decarboxylase [Acidobacteriaceae bacterium]
MAKTTVLESLKHHELESPLDGCVENVSLWLAFACLFAFFALFYSHTASAAEPPHVWKASWITSPEAPRWDECVLQFRKEIELGATPAHFQIHVSADNQYLLKVNGKYVGTGPSHSDIQHWKYTTYDIAPLLHQGENLISAIVWNFGEDAPVRQITDRIGFLLDGESTNPVEIHTDATWSVAVEKGLHGVIFFPPWVGDNPHKTVCFQNEHLEEMLRLRDAGPTYPKLVVDEFATISFMEDCGINNEQVINCAVDKLSEGYAARTN